MNPKQFEIWVREAIFDADADDGGPGIRRIETYEEAQVLTTDRGLVIAFQDGSEFQVTLVQSRRGGGDDDAKEDEQ